MQGESLDEQMQSVAMEISECSQSKVDYNKIIKKILASEPHHAGELESHVKFASVRGSFFISRSYDLLEHKHNLDWKGTSGNVCCLTCANLDRRLRGDHHGNVIGLDCSDPTVDA